MITYLFFRETGFYMLELHDDAEAIANAECNAGTLKIETMDGKLVWKSS